MLESHFLLLQVLAFEAGRRHKIRVNTISAGMPVSHLYAIMFLMNRIKVLPFLCHRLDKSSQVH